MNACTEPDGSPVAEAFSRSTAHLRRVGARTPAQVEAAIGAARLKVVDRMDVRPHHPRAADKSDPLHAARAAEVTSLWRLAVADKQ